ncbi:hypothetical protein HMPREF0548_1049 [Lactobacillus ultunensis DSM 16047]|uniref:Uncharacterized protein n=1 Tax=Lactobacillus ultunensis DSM 16047 TaxID=525365 RepID=C2EN03_9LACO|nr:hypothetical protein HMPREF0548_1049 [Lactobacillus ultunensis DSM 16047]
MSQKLFFVKPVCVDKIAVGKTDGCKPQAPKIGKATDMETCPAHERS